MPQAGRPAQIWAKLNSLVDPELIDALYRGLAGRRADRPRGARHLLPAPRRAGPVREHPRQEHHRPLPRALPHRLLRQRRRPAVARRPRSSSPRPTGCRATSTGGVETLVPIENPTVHQQVLDQIMVANLKDEAQSWVLRRRRHATPACIGGPGAFSAHTYFMTNPSLSGRGSALKKAKKAPQLDLKKA